MTKLEARRWVRTWWADQMRNPTVPDLGGLSEADQDLIQSVWHKTSRHAAEKISRESDPS